ncbi:MAG TPA: RNA methyltransferase [Chryseosolibacter sp.]|nr:RNA methyltransferase [Chryseosolibacter sp.]
MLSKATIKFIKSLQVKKYRKQEQCFVIEGGKSVEELLASDFEVVKVLGTPEFLSETKATLRGEVIEVTESILETLGEFRSNRTALAIAKIKPNSRVEVGSSEYGLVLDDVRDPGNLGTIIRTADWYGIAKIIVSPETADFYNPKVISATMGSFTRVQLYYTDLSTFLSATRLPVYGAFLEGADVHRVAFKAGGLLVVGSESHGISAEVERFVTEKITIPRFGAAESLNAGIATAVICDNIRRVVGLFGG